MKYGFHEDGFTAGLEAAMAIAPEIRLPFPVVDSTYSRGLMAGPVGWDMWVVRLVVGIVQMMIVLFTVQGPAVWDWGVETLRGPRSWRSRVKLTEGEKDGAYMNMSKQMM